MGRLFLILLISSVGVFWTTQRADVSGRQTFYGDWYVPPPESVYFSFGYSEVIADGLWLRVIQNFDFCETRDVEKGEVVMPYERAKTSAETRSQDNSGMGGQALTTGRQPSCEGGWAYQMLDRITDYSPNFRIAYSMGATTLSVLVDDRLGAMRLFEKALRQYPDDWNIEFRAAYHYLIEMKDTQRAADLLLRVAQHGGPDWAASLAARLYTKVGQALLAKEILTEMLDAYGDDGPQAERLKTRLAEAQKVLDEGPQN